MNEGLPGASCGLRVARDSFFEESNCFDHFRHSIGGSDCHMLEQVGRACTEFVNPVQTIDDMIGEIRKGNSRGVYMSRAYQ